MAFFDQTVAKRAQISGCHHAVGGQVLLDGRHIGMHLPLQGHHSVRKGGQALLQHSHCR